MSLSRPATLQEFRKFNTDRMHDYLMERLPNISPKAIQILTAGEFEGDTLSAMTAAELQECGILPGPAYAIVKLIGKLKSGISPRSTSPPSPAPPSQAPPAKKPHQVHSPANLKPYRDLFDIIVGGPKDPLETDNDYCDPGKLLTLPFPFWGSRPNERFPPNPTNTFEYMGREKFKEISEAIGSLRDNDYTNVYVYGTIGYGKSYILAALACHLFRKQKRVVYLPDCRELAGRLVSYIKSGLFLAFGDDLDSQQEIEMCEKVDDLARFCRKISRNLHLYFIIDQFNALDHELEQGKIDKISNSDKDAARRALREITDGHYSITSASANHQSALFMQTEQCNDVRISLQGGLSEFEMTNWWSVFASKLPILQTAEKDFIEDLTGRIPLLLRPLINPDHQGKSFSEPKVNSTFHNAWEIQQIIKFTYEFATNKMGKLKEKEPVNWRAYINVMKCCILQTTPLDNRVELFDHRFFYVDDTCVGRSTCGLARGTMIGFLRSAQEDPCLSSAWLNAMVDFRHNPSMLDFFVKQACLSNIAWRDIGLRINMPTLIFRGPSPAWKEVPEGVTLLLPLASNHKAIDGLVVSINEWKKKVDMFAIKITISQKHTDSELAFFSEWETWSLYYREIGYTVAAKVLHITGDSSMERAVVGGTVVGASINDCWNPQYTKVLLSISDINRQIADRYKHARTLTAE